ncbi:hypothetical protein PGB90_004643 [Kerria lacca]
MMCGELEILLLSNIGKTTTTERMLYYSGTINQMGEVHEGNTVTDYLEQERDRGITITSASVTIPWLNHRINIIDTPGHIDFTFEVEQSLKVIDGAIVILDGSAGVEAQTVTVWMQADKYNIPRIVYINKMDRLDSSFTYCLTSLREKFNTEFLGLQKPIQGEKTGIKSIVDIINKNILIWSGDQGENISRNSLSECDKLYDEVQNLHNELVDKLAYLDDDLAEIVLKNNSLDNINVVSIYDALKRVTLSRKAVPVLCGSSYKNIGVQKLMDAVVNILPSPDMREDLNIYNFFENNLCAQAFKVVHNKQKGPITFFRLYSGNMLKSQKLYVINKNKIEQIQKLMIPFADEYSEINEISRGNIVAATGLKAVFSGDFITNSSTSLKSAVKKLCKERKLSEEEGQTLLCPSLKIPEPVFFCSIEAPSKKYQVVLDTALEELQKDDPSLQVKIEPDTGQTILGGMGELHLEIIKDRILKKYKVDADIGPLQIAYKEYLISEAKQTYDFAITLGDTHHSAMVTLSVFPMKNKEQNFLILDKSVENIVNTSQITSKQLTLIKNGLELAVQRGPKVGCPIQNANFMIHWLEIKKFTTDSIISSAAAQCAQKALAVASTVLIEPCMKLEVITDEENIGYVLTDLSRKGSEITEYLTHEKNRIVRAFVPLSKLLGYSKELRTRTSGNATFTMEFHSYKKLEGIDELEAIKEITGFYPVNQQ